MVGSRPKMPSSGVGGVSPPRRPAPPGRRPGAKKLGATSFKVEDDNNPALSPSKPAEDNCVAVTADNSSGREGAEKHLKNERVADVAVEPQAIVLDPSSDDNQVDAAEESAAQVYMTEDGVPVVYVEGVGWVAAQEGSDGQLYCVLDEAAPELVGQLGTDSGDVIVGERERNDTVGQEVVRSDDAVAREEERGQAPLEKQGAVRDDVEPVAVHIAPEPEVTTVTNAVMEEKKRLEQEEAAELARLTMLREEEERKRRAALNAERVRVAEEQARMEREWEAQLAAVEQAYPVPSAGPVSQKTATSRSIDSGRDDSVLLASLLASRARMSDPPHPQVAAPAGPTGGSGAASALFSRPEPTPACGQEGHGGRGIKSVDAALEEARRRKAEQAYVASQSQPWSKPPPTQPSGPQQGPQAAEYAPPPPLTAVPKYTPSPQRPASLPRDTQTAPLAQQLPPPSQHGYGATAVDTAGYGQPATSTLQGGRYAYQGPRDLSGIDSMDGPQYRDHSGYRQPDLPARPPAAPHAQSTPGVGYTSFSDTHVTGTPVPLSLSAYGQQGTLVHPPTSHQAATYACTPPRSSGETYRGPFDSPDAFYRTRTQRPAEAYSNVPPDFQQQLRDAYEAGRAREAQGGKPGGKYPRELEHEEAPRQSRTAVGLLYGGVLTLCVYGTAEATDQATGSAYTEYIVQCTWGPTQDCRRPWVVARRYREFYSLDASLRAAYPELDSQLPTLPPKDWWSSLCPHVVTRRQMAFEVYLGHIVANLPLVLRSSLVDRFLTITERVTRIRQELGLPPVDMRDLDQPTDSDSTRRPSTTAREDVPTRVFGVDMRRLTSEAAQQAFEEQRVAKVDERGLVELEHLARDLHMLLKRIDTRGDFMRNAALQDHLHRLESLWPRLKALTNDLDVADPYTAPLIPRALECDDDLSAVATQLRSLVAVRYGGR